MRKFFGSLVVVALIVVAVFIVMHHWRQLPSRLAAALERILKVSVSIEEVRLRMNGLSLHRIALGNPPCYREPNSMCAEKIVICMPWRNLFRDLIVIDRVQICDLFLSLEFKRRLNLVGNWHEIKHNLLASEASHPFAGKTVVIRSLLLSNVNVEYSFLSSSKPPRKMEPIAAIEFFDLKSTRGTATEEITESIISGMLRSVSTAENIEDMDEEDNENPTPNNPA